ncbi:beta-xylosidase [Lentzea guizhouensis]|uniref:Beta-xylosidase n=1 Tax=Lentzea guizhouensis TaxID=1586287 RepID=A0A1B2HTU0_9PSEU|nr:family 43 glycosylhydrolase [Lentzea guizhouensis]ANZ41144.1 beta-xylosidase [Lentzea guizhouensis]
MLSSLRHLGVVVAVTAALLPVTPAAAQPLVRAAADAVAVPNLDDVRGHLTLPTIGANDTTITWRSSNAGVITPTGEVSRPPAGSKATKVVLTAKVSRGQQSTTRALTATVQPLPVKEPLAGYSFFYFTGESSPIGEQVYAAASRGNNPLDWTEVNGGQPVLKSSLGELGVRDPFILRSPDGDRFYLLATDLKINGGRGWDAAQRTGSRSIMVWESTDLRNWSRQRSVQVSPPTAGNTWAPEALWDAQRGTYVVYWASKLYAENDPNHTGSSYNRMMYATTRDFVTFSPAKVWIDPGYSVIDSTVIEHQGTYYRYTKDERNNSSSSPCSKYITAEKSTDLLDPSYDFVAECIGKATSTSPGLSAGEGPTGFKSNTEDRWYLFIDEYGGRGYVPFETTDLASGRWTMSTGFRLPASPRHGTVLPVTQAELDRLTAPPAPVRADSAGLVAHWPLNATSGAVARDATGHGYDGVLAGNATWSSGALSFGGGHVQLPNNMLTGASAATISADVLVDPAQQTPYFLYGFGNTAANGVGNGYLFSTGDSYRGAIAIGDWTTEQGVDSGRALPRGVWKNVTLTVGGGVAVLYLDGVEVGRTAATTKPSDLGGGITAANYLGRSVYAGDRPFLGRMKDVRLYNRALSGTDVAALPFNSTLIRSAGHESLKAPAVIEPGSVVLPVRPGADLRRVRLDFGLAPGATITPSGPVDLRKPRKFVVRSGRESREWTVEAHELRSPVLPGLNADPHIVAFGDTYYLYPTTDGFPGWSGTKFSAWSSKNLVDWRDEGVVLDLGPDVSWADGRAWAPAIAERNGRYYFYFCAEAKIGVAVGDSPTGPFVDSGKPLVARNPSGSGQAIDPAVFVDGTGQPYLYWGNGEAYVVPLNEDMVSYDEAKITRIDGLTDFREGLFMVERKGTYYLSWSVDDTRSEDYRVAHATAPSPTGPFTSRGLVLSKDTRLGVKGTGHSSMLQVPGTDDWYLAYHRFAIPGGDGVRRETTIDKMTFAADGTIKPVVPTLEGVAPQRVRPQHCRALFN